MSSERIETPELSAERALIELRDTIEMIPVNGGMRVVEFVKGAVERGMTIGLFRVFDNDMWSKVLYALLVGEPSGCRFKICQRYFIDTGVHNDKKDLRYLWEVTVVGDNIGEALQQFRTHLQSALLTVNGWNVDPATMTKFQAGMPREEQLAVRRAADTGIITPSVMRDQRRAAAKNPRLPSQSVIDSVPVSGERVVKLPFSPLVKNHHKKVKKPAG